MREQFLVFEGRRLADQFQSMFREVKVRGAEREAVSLYAAAAQLHQSRTPVQMGQGQFRIALTPAVELHFRAVSLLQLHHHALRLLQANCLVDEAQAEEELLPGLLKPLRQLRLGMAVDEIPD